VPGANCAAADANTPSQLAFAGGAAPAEDAPTRARALAPIAARSVSFRIRLPSVGVKRRYHGVWDLKWVQTCPVAVRVGRRTSTRSDNAIPGGTASPPASGVTRSANPARLNHDRDRHEHDDEVVPQRPVIENVDDEQRECGENHYPVRPRVAGAVGTDHSAAICAVGPCLPLLWVGHAAASIAPGTPRGQPDARPSFDGDDGRPSTARPARAAPFHAVACRSARKRCATATHKGSMPLAMLQASMR
jgi:hypothetical protein